MNIGRVTTPTGDSVFVKVNEPDMTYGAPGSYTATIALTSEAADEFRLLMAPHIKNALRQLKSDGANVDKDTLSLPIKVQEDGTVHITSRIKAGGTNRKTGEEFFNSVQVIDVEGDDASSVLVGKGSKIKLSADVIPYNFNGKVGISLRLKSIQIVKLVEVGSSSGPSAKKSTNVPF